MYTLHPSFSLNAAKISISTVRIDLLEVRYIPSDNFSIHWSSCYLRAFNIGDFHNSVRVYSISFQSSILFDYYWISNT